jgi:Arc/MetJ family transcription regulator
MGAAVAQAPWPSFQRLLAWIKGPSGVSLGRNSAKLWHCHRAPMRLLKGERSFQKAPRCPELQHPPWTARLRHTYQDGKKVWMKKTLNIDDRLLAEAKLASGARTDTDTIRLGLEAVVRHAAYERLRALRGTEPHALDVSRRRERATLKAPPKRKVA